ncbi:unnamed protein product, partial [Brassica rapa subsp. trilocularis]
QKPILPARSITPREDLGFRSKTETRASNMSTERGEKRKRSKTKKTRGKGERASGAGANASPAGAKASGRRSSD